MADITAIRHRIKSINDTHQITKAMELISVSKMRKMMNKQAYSSLYFDSVRYTVKDILRHSPDVRNKYTMRRSGGRAKRSRNCTPSARPAPPWRVGAWSRPPARPRAS